jgi:hypothetical protein
MWSKVKAALRAAEARTHDALLDALASALDSISASDARNWFPIVASTLFNMV